MLRVRADRQLREVPVVDDEVDGARHISAGESGN
jgi:hypothetical protein